MLLSVGWLRRPCFVLYFVAQGKDGSTKKVPAIGPSPALLYMEREGASASTRHGNPAPSISQQKMFIEGNTAILDKKTKLAILSVVMMEIGASAVMDTGSNAKEVDIDLDLVEAANEEVLTHIYNIVSARRDLLSQPASSSAYH
jgi:hypothetical protein